MKPKTVIAALLFTIAIFIVHPLIFSWLNLKLNLLIVSSFPLRIVGIIILLIGITFETYLISLFYLIGKGTPAPIQPPIKLVTLGVYKYTRNPMYISILSILLGYFFIFGHILLLLNLVLTAIFFHFFIIFYEEPTLKKKFGKDYQKYCKKVPRWIRLPKLISPRK